MALKLDDTYPGRANGTSAEYPQGSFKNKGPAKNTGTPLDQAWANDVLGFLQKLLDESNVTPSGVPDNVAASDYFNALKLLPYVTGSGSDTLVATLNKRPIVFDTEADMIAQTALAPGMTVRTLGKVAVADGLGQTFKIVASGGDVVLANGNEALIVSKFKTATGVETGQAAFDNRVVRATSIADMKTKDAAVGQIIELAAGGRSGTFEVKSGTPPSDPQEGIYVVLANGNYAERSVVEYLTPEMFGAVGDGVAYDWPQALAAFNFSKTITKKTVFNGEKSYYLGAFPTTGKEIKFNCDVDGLTVETNNCNFLLDVSLDASHIANDDQTLFEIAANNISIGDFTAVGNQIQKSPSRIGFLGINVSNPSINTENLTLGTVVCEKALATMQCITTDPALYRHKNINFTLLDNKDGYYTLNCAENGDDIRGTVTSTGSIRTYFVYGVDNHRVVVDSKDHAQFTDLLIKRYIRDTANIDVLYRCTNDLSSDATVGIEFQTNDTDAVIENVSVKMLVEKSNAANPTIEFKSLDAAGNILTTTTNQFKNINLSGETNTTNASRLRVLSGMAGAAVSDVTITKHLFGRTNDTKGYVFIIPEDGHIATADSSNSMTLDFKIRDLAFAVPIIAKVELAAFDNATGGTAEYFSRDLLVLFSVSADGSVTVLNNQAGNTLTAGVLAPTLSLPNQPAGTYSLKVVVNNYTGANRFVKGRFIPYAFQED